MILILTATLNQTVQADTWIDIHLVSMHSSPTYTKDGKEYAYNEKNIGLGLDIPRTKNASYIAGFYDNSYNNTTVYGGMDFHSAGIFAMGVSAGLVTGYQSVHDTSNSAYVKPLVVLTFVVKKSNFRVKGGITGNGDAITFSLGYKL